ncbi:IS3 family transposase [Peribacillus deserti]|uniref:IS3 family transposase n=1 Tax=Peribacillus deserti TaxID=673318 RepID=UPI0015E0B9DE
MKNFDRLDPDVENKELIQSIYDEHEGRFGYRRIRDELRNRGRKVNHKKVQRIITQKHIRSDLKSHKRHYRPKHPLTANVFLQTINIYVYINVSFFNLSKTFSEKLKVFSFRNSKNIFQN